MPQKVYNKIMRAIWNIQMGSGNDDVKELADALESLMMYVEVDD